MQAKPEVHGYRGGGFTVAGQGQVAIKGVGVALGQPGNRYTYYVDVEVGPDSNWYECRLLGQRVD